MNITWIIKTEEEKEAILEEEEDDYTLESEASSQIETLAPLLATIKRILDSNLNNKANNQHHMPLQGILLCTTIRRDIARENRMKPIS